MFISLALNGYHDDGQRNDHSGDRQTLDALREQHGEVELETEQDDAEAQQLVGLHV